ncbi:MAG: DNA primase [Myxococcales bacterium]|nr:DNA primase [Myxococcales bacterium]
MAQIPPEKLQEVRDRADIERVVSRYVRLTKRGRRYVGLCPFHSEKTPSFGVSTEKGLYHCFGCGEGGDVIDFVRKIDGLDFVDAVKSLAREFGVQIEDRPETPKEKAQRTRKQQLFDVNRLAGAFYAKCLERFPDAQRYLIQERGLTPETIAAFRLGWAPADWQSLANLFEKKGVDLELGLEVGLLGKSAREGRIYDRLRGRVVFPIEIPGGMVAGFGARRADWVDPEGPKYLNSPESPIYDKSTILYGLAPARQEIRRSRQAILVEGYLDVIALFQAGFHRAVAGCGTALTRAHAQTLARMTEEVITMYDGDTAGQEATQKAAMLLLAEGLRVRVVNLPDGEDPDTFVRRQGADSLQKLIDEAPSAIDFFVARARAAQAGGGIAGTTRALDAVKPMILAIKDPLERDVTLQAASRALGVDAQLLRRHLGAKIPPAPKAPQIRAPQTRQARVSPVEIAILRRVLEAPAETLPTLESNHAFDAFQHDAIRMAVEAARGALADGMKFDAPQALDRMRETGADEGTLTEIRRHLLDSPPAPDPVDQLVARLMESHKKAQLARLKAELLKNGDLSSLERASEVKKLLDPNA